MLNIKLVEGATGVMPRRMGRKMQYPEKREAALTAGTLARVEDVVRRQGGTVAGYIREAIDEKLARDEREIK